MDEQERRIAFADGVLDKVEGEIPAHLWEKKAQAFEEWRRRSLNGLLKNWNEFFDVGMPSGRLMRLYCLGVARGMEQRK